MNTHIIEIDESKERKLISKVKSIVIKIGTNVLVAQTGEPNKECIEKIAADIAWLKNKGYAVLLVSSGAIGAGLKELGFKNRPTDICDLQTAAAVGQLKLINLYNKYFTKLKCKISQVLLTHDDIKDKKRNLNAKNTILNLLKHNIIPIINENDVVANEEIKIGDNDVLSSMVCTLVGADLLIMLTTPDGLQKPSEVDATKTERICYLPKIDSNVFKYVGEKQNQFSTGGMASKLHAASAAVDAGAYVVIASGRQKSVIKNIIAGKSVGTLIGAKF